MSVRTVRRILREPAVEGSADDGVAREARHIGRPNVTEELRERVGALSREDPERPPGEISRLLRDEGTPLGLIVLNRG